LIEDLDVDDIDSAIEKANTLIKEKPQISELYELRKNLESMKIALLEMKRLRDDFERGNVTSEQYWVQNKKLRTDFERSKHETFLLEIIQKLPEEKKSRLLKIKEAIMSNKDFILFVVEVLTTLAGKIS